MTAFLYGLGLQWKLDIRSKTLLITCYLVPLLFFALMGGIFTSILPGSEATLLPAMTVFGGSMGAMIGLPPSLVELYGSDIRKVYQANGVPMALGLVLSGLSAFLHLFWMSILLYLLAPVLFDAALPTHPGAYFAGLALFLLASLAISGLVGLALKDPGKTSMVSILLFLPSILLSGILFPADLLPSALQSLGNLFPATWGYRLLAQQEPAWESLWPLLLLLAAAGVGCALLLRRIRTRL